MKASVQAMIDDPTAPVAPLAEWMHDYTESHGAIWDKISHRQCQELFNALLRETASILAEKDLMEALMKAMFASVAQDDDLDRV